ncbi:MAG: PAS domain-containing protein, partial [Pseudomonadota bacterium]
MFLKWANKEKSPVEFVSQNILTILGYTPDDFMEGKIKYFDLIHPDDIAKVMHEIDYSSTHGIDEFTHELYRIKDNLGNYHHVYEHTQIIRDNQGNIIHYQGYISDETDFFQKQERLELVLSGTGLGLWDWNPSTNHVVFDERWANMLAYKLSEVEPSLESWESKVHPDDISDCYKDIQKHLDGKTPFYNNIHRMMHKDGKWRYILDRGRVVERDIDNKPIRFTGTHTDVTELKESEIKLKKRTLELERLNQQQNNIV